MELKASLFDENAISRTIKRMAHEILEKNDSAENICLIGIKTRGLPLAQRIAACIYAIEGREIPVAMLDVTQFRDDIVQPESGEEISFELPFSVAGKNVILVDDVIYTGRTVRAAMDAVIGKGRPAKIQLAVLVDRGHRELPIRPDYAGKNIPTSKSEIVRVRFCETDGEDSVSLFG